MLLAGLPLDEVFCPLAVIMLNDLLNELSIVDFVVLRCLVLFGVCRLNVGWVSDNYSS